MKTEDETFLSAYLDGELDPEQRARVDSALLSNPALAERLRQLTVVRDLVANLPRLTLHEDLASAVLARSRAQVPGSLVTRLSRAPLARVGLAAAALAVLSVGLGLFVARTRPDAPALAPQPVLVTTGTPTKPELIPGPQVKSRPSELLAARGSDAPPVAPTPRPVASQRDEAELQIDRERMRIRKLLDSPDLKHVFVVVDEIGGDLPRRVEGLVRDTARLDPVFGKITVSQGIVIDPKHPNEATVFALVMDQDEVKQFRNRLNLDFPTQVEESTPDPMVVTQLSGIGQVAVSSGPRATALAPPPGGTDDIKTALRTHNTPPKSKNQTVIYRPSPEFDGIPVPEVPPRPPVSSDDLATLKPSPEREASGPPSSPAKAMDPIVALPVAKEDAVTESSAGNPPSSPSLDKARQRPTSVVLVWVTTRDPVPKGRR